MMRLRPMRQSRKLTDWKRYSLYLRLFRDFPFEPFASEGEAVRAVVELDACRRQYDDMLEMENL